MKARRWTKWWPVLFMILVLAFAWGAAAHHSMPAHNEGADHHGHRLHDESIHEGVHVLEAASHPALHGEHHLEHSHHVNHGEHVRL